MVLSTVEGAGAAPYTMMKRRAVLAFESFLNCLELSGEGKLNSYFTPRFIGHFTTSDFVFHHNSPCAEHALVFSALSLQPFAFSPSFPQARPCPFHLSPLASFFLERSDPSTHDRFLLFPPFLERRDMRYYVISGPVTMRRCKPGKTVINSIL